VGSDRFTVHDPGIIIFDTVAKFTTGWKIEFVLELDGMEFVLEVSEIKLFASNI